MKKRKVLMITYYYPPLGGAGVLRTLKFAKYLATLGWQPNILTPDEGVCSISCDRKEGDLAGVEVVRTGYFDVFGFARKEGKTLDRGLLYLKDSVDEQKHGLKRRLLSFLTRFAFNWIAFPDSRIGWYKYAVRRGLRVIKERKVSLIYSTSSPETAHLIAYSLKRKTGLPWVADFRDLWTQSHGYKRNTARLWMERRVERKVLKEADALITVSEPLANQLRSLDRSFKMKVHTITNGFDPEDLPEVEGERERFVITYTGTVYMPGQNPEPLFKAVRELLQENLIDPNEKVEIAFYGPDNENLAGLAKSYKLLDGVAKLHGLLPIHSSLEIQKKSTILLLLDWDDPNYRGIYTTKVFEYLGARRPILSISPYESVVTDLIRKTNAGGVARNAEEVKGALLRWYQEFSRTGRVQYHGIEAEIMKHTRKHKTKQLFQVFERALEG